MRQLVYIIDITYVSIAAMVAFTPNKYILPATPFEIAHEFTIERYQCAGSIAYKNRRVFVLSLCVYYYQCIFLRIRKNIFLYERECAKLAPDIGRQMWDTR